MYTKSTEHSSNDEILDGLTKFTMIEESTGHEQDTVEQMRVFDNSRIIFISSPKNICCECSLESSW